MAKPSVLCQSCELCSSVGGELVWENTLCRVVNIDDPDYPGFCRVILNRHEREMTDLSEDAQQEMMRVVFAVEASLRRLLNPHKINLASLGNMTPHVHWHVIPRWRDDRCYPNPIWASALRTDSSIDAIIDTCRLREELTVLLGEPAAASSECRS
ncbi:MAG: HIT family protein [Propionivibrio sp.]|uniref:HIT family protein n=1 Tax=Candidatus Propionivibrio dominans TaxID=2954373 RepID=A0A9D7I872_9RHOO|nr:HIT family protein [Candidatus Propionivibrio dominans]MBL0165880.1 HIT family protein [Propionivibrio sp.]